MVKPKNTTSANGRDGLYIAIQRPIEPSLMGKYSVNVFSLHRGVCKHHSVDEMVCDTRDKAMALAGTLSDQTGAKILVEEQEV